MRPGYEPRFSGSMVRRHVTRQALDIEHAVYTSDDIKAAALAAAWHRSLAIARLYGRIG